MVICLERGANLHMAQLMPLPLTVSCFSKIQIGFTFLVPAHPDSPGQRAVKRVCVCVCVYSYPTRCIVYVSYNTIVLAILYSLQLCSCRLFVLVVKISKYISKTRHSTLANVIDC